MEETHRIMEVIENLREFIHTERNFTSLDDFFNFLVEIYKYETSDWNYQLQIHIDCYKNSHNIEDKEVLRFLKRLKKYLRILYRQNKEKPIKQLHYEKIKSITDKWGVKIEILDFK